MTGQNTGIPVAVYSSTDIANRAILKLGGHRDTPRLADINDTDNSIAVLFKETLGWVTKEVLAVPPAFIESVKYNDLSTENEVVEKADWTYAFDLPSDCIRVIAQVHQQNRKHKAEFAVMGRVLLTNELTNDDGDGPFIVYVYDNVDPEIYSPLLTETIACKLAAEVCLHLGKDPRERQALMEEYQRLCRVRALELNQSSHYDRDDDEMGNDDYRKARVSGAYYRPDCWGYC